MQGNMWFVHIDAPVTDATTTQGVILLLVYHLLLLTPIHNTHDLYQNGNTDDHYCCILNTRSALCKGLSTNVLVYQALGQRGRHRITCRWRFTLAASQPVEPDPSLASARPLLHCSCPGRP
jgi:hypothetical protein